jgi:hypothetical protein
MTSTCRQCGLAFEPPRHPRPGRAPQLPRARYCSDACRTEARRRAGLAVHARTHCLVCRTALRVCGPLCQACFERGIALAGAQEAA